MPGQPVTKDTYDFKRRFATALKCTYTVCSLSWKCPLCGATNHTKFDGKRLRHSYGINVEARCGKCHGPNVHLLDAKNRHILLDELLTHA